MRPSEVSTNAAISTEVVHVQNSNEPSWLLYREAHFMCVSMSVEETEAT